MELKYLGTAAAEGWPGLFCDCEGCRKALEAVGRNIRARSQAIVDGCLLIDFPADSWHNAIRHGVSMHSIHSLLITHTHCDHLYPSDLEMRRTGFAYFDDPRPLTVYGSAGVGDAIMPVLEGYDLIKDNRVLFHELEAFRALEIEGYTVTPLPADHDPASGPLIYNISSGGKTMLYANDTGYFRDEVWAWMEASRPQYNFISLDCTGIVLPYEKHHMGLEANEKVVKRMRGIGCIDDNTKICVHHFSHNGLKIYDELVPIAAQYGFDVSYDGKTVTF